MAMGLRQRRRFAVVSAMFVLLYLGLLVVEHQTIGSLDAQSGGHSYTATTTKKGTRFLLDKEEELPWVLLTKDPSQHNQTKEGTELPGLYWENRLWLLGGRLTTSYEPEDDRVFLTLFGMPGDFYARTKQHRVRCPANEWYNGDNGTVWSYPEARAKARLFAAPSGHDEDNLIPLEFMRTISGDTHQNNNTLVWHGDLSPSGITAGAIRRKASTHSWAALRLNVYAAAEDRERSRIFTVDIPLSTGTVGQAGPQYIAPGRSSLFLSEKEEDRGTKPMDAAVCVAVYSERSLAYLPEFVVHHSNLGFGQVVVGIIDGLLGSAKIEKAASSLKDLIDRGTVTIAVMGMEMLECEVNVRKEHFYNACLYHAKGIAEYVGIWDIDEYWLPSLPSELQSTRTTTTTSSRTNGIATRVETTLKKAESPNPISNNTDLMTSPQFGYAEAPKVGQVMARIQSYQEQAGCGESWCYHSFPSWMVWLRRNNVTSEEPAVPIGRIGDDFGLRQNEIDWSWSKSITRTKYAYMGGLHQTGSCRFPHTPPGNFESRQRVTWKRGPYPNLSPIHDDAAMPNLSRSGTTRTNEECWNLVMPGFGMMHHFYSLNRIRSIDKTEFRKSCAGMGEDDKKNDDNDDDGSSVAVDGCSVDEYVESFAPTVKRQLDARSISASLKS